MTINHPVAFIRYSPMRWLLCWFSSRNLIIPDPVFRLDEYVGMQIRPPVSDECQTKAVLRSIERSATSAAPPSILQQHHPYKPRLKQDTVSQLTQPTG